MANDLLDVELPTTDAVRTALFNAQWYKYTTGALIVGGGTITLTLLLAGTIIQEEVCVAFQALFIGFLAAASVFSYRTTSMISRPMPIREALTPGVFAMLIAFSTAMDTIHPPDYWPIRPYTYMWWLFVGMALLAAIFGARLRMFADFNLEMLKQLQENLKRIERAENG